MTPSEVLWLAAKFAGLTVVLTRVIVLVVEDSVLSRPRDWIKDWSIVHRHPKLGAFVICPWCIGFWVCVAGTQLLTHLGYVSLPLPALWAFAVNQVAAMWVMLLDKWFPDNP